MLAPHAAPSTAATSITTRKLSAASTCRPVTKYITAHVVTITACIHRAVFRYCSHIATLPCHPPFRNAAAGAGAGRRPRHPVSRQNARRDHADATCRICAFARLTSVAGTFSGAVGVMNSGYPDAPISGMSSPAISTAAGTRFPTTFPIT